MTALVLERIHKAFGGMLAVENASLVLEPGKLHAVVGENGAGKSTLLKIGAGILRPDAGLVRLDGQILLPHTAAEAIRRGVAMVEQHFALVGPFTGLENLVLGTEPTRSFGRLDLERARGRAKEVADELGVELALDEPVASLGVGDRQRLEIARALYRRARVLILDEPTAVLTPKEAGDLYAVLKRLAAGGRAVAVVTHKPGEVTSQADTVTVMRRGRVIESRTVDAGDREKEERAIASSIMGREPLPELVRREPPDPSSAAVFGMHSISFESALHEVSLELRAGEIVGIAGIEGNGQRELVRVAAGLATPTLGTMSGDRPIVVHEDRQREGLVLEASIADNLLLGELGRFTGFFGVLRLNAIRVEALRRWSRHVDAKQMDAPSSSYELDRPVGALSGGNQQKVVMARALAQLATGHSRALVVAHPTRGVDLGASRVIHEHLLAAADGGAGVLVISADLAELRALTSRILVLRRGRIVSELPPTANDMTLGEAMLGVRQEARAQVTANGGLKTRQEL